MRNFLRGALGVLLGAGIVLGLMLGGRTATAQWERGTERPMLERIMRAQEAQAKALEALARAAERCR